MDLKLKSVKENKVFDRKEVVAEVKFSGSTPKRYEVLEALSKSLEVEPELIVIRNINNVYGGSRAIVYARVYFDKNTLKNIELGHYLKRTEKTKPEEKAEETEENAESSETKEEKKEESETKDENAEKSE